MIGAGPSVAAIVLAAGRSTRMGANKLLAKARGKPLVRHVVDAASESRALPVVVVTGHEGELVRAALEGCKVAFVDNPDFSKGLSTSLQAGVNALPAVSDGAVILLGDMPAVSGSTINCLIEAFARARSAAAVVPVHAGQRGNPVLVSRRVFGDIARLTGDVGARPILAAHMDVIEISADEGVALDIDTPAALEALLQKP